MAIIEPSKRLLCMLGLASFFILSGQHPGACIGSTPRIPDRSQALVAIRTVSVVRATGDKVDGIANLFLAQDPRRCVTYSRSGSGVILDPRGIIVTNAHLVQNAAGISVELFNGTRLEGRMIRVLPESDIAFLSVKPFFPLSSVSLADSERLVPGDPVYCIGRALNHNGVLMDGKISAMLKPPAPRMLRAEFLQIQFGFHLYGGDSGSPIFDRKGFLVGLVSAGRRSGDRAALAVASNVIREAYWTIPK